MPLTQLAPPYPIFTDKSGSPLDNGYLYFGTANLNPETNPITVYYDALLTQPAAQPLRTSNGYVMRNGSPAAIYTNGYFSVTVRDKNKSMVIYSPSGYGISPGTAASSTDQMTYNEGSTGAVNRVLTSRLQDYVSVKDFGAVGNGVADDTAAIQLALNSGGNIYIPDGVYMLATKTTVSPEISFLRVPNNTRIYGSRNAILKVAPNVGDYTGVFTSATTYGSGVAENIQFYGFTIDQDAASNTTCNITAGVSAKTSGAIIIVRTHHQVSVENMLFLNAPGVNTVSLNGPVSSNAKINGNTFKFLTGTSTTVNSFGHVFYDNSLVYIEANGFECNDNWSYNTTEISPGNYTGGRTAYEVHGGNGTICRNQAFRFATLANVVGFLSGQDIVPLNNLVVNENMASDCRAGIALWALTGTLFEGFEVNENLISLNPSKFDDNGSSTFGVTFITATGVAGTYKNGNILNNVIKYDGDLESSLVANRSAGIGIDTGGIVSSVNIKGNQICNAPCNGISVYQQIGAFSRIDVSDNFILDAGLNSLSSIRFGILWRGVVSDSICQNNLVVDTATPTANISGGTSTQFLGATSSIVSAGNVCESVSTTPVRNNYSVYDLSQYTTNLSATGGATTISPETGKSVFNVTCSTTGAVTLAITTFSYPVPTGAEITINIKNTSGGTTAITPTASFVFSTPFVNLTTGQQCTLRFKFDGAALKWYQTGPQVTVAS